MKTIFYQSCSICLSQKALMCIFNAHFTLIGPNKNNKSTKQLILSSARNSVFGFGIKRSANGQRVKPRTKKLKLIRLLRVNKAKILNCFVTTNSVSGAV